MKAFVLLSVLSLLCGACGEVRKCTYGAPGCFAGKPDNDECDVGLVVVNGTCAEPDRASPPLRCDCPDGQVCTLDSYRCVNYCAPLDGQIGSEPATPMPSCDPESLGFAQLCRNTCVSSCRQQAEFCGTPCDETRCDDQRVLAACETSCKDAAEPLRCIAESCAKTRALGCRDVTCDGQRLPECDDVLCRNNCPSYNFDGVCDDGDFKSASSGVCPYGTDCADCGPRRGAVPSPVAQGQPCAFHSNCRGNNSQDLSLADAWCIQIDPNAAISRCAPDCSDPVETCPEGSACFVLGFPDRDGDGAADQLRTGALTASACFPVQCGG